jgi:hypothetical protein
VVRKGQFRRGSTIQKRDTPASQKIALDTHELGWVKFAFGFAIGFAKTSMLAPTRLKMGLEEYPRLLMASSHVAYILCCLVRIRAGWEAGCKSIHETLSSRGSTLFASKDYYYYRIASDTFLVIELCYSKFCPKVAFSSRPLRKRCRRSWT